MTWYLECTGQWFCTRFDIPYDEPTNPLGVGKTEAEAVQNYHDLKHARTN